MVGVVKFSAVAEEKNIARLGCVSEHVGGADGAAWVARDGKLEA